MSNLSSIISQKTGLGVDFPAGIGAINVDTQHNKFNVAFNEPVTVPANETVIIGPLIFHGLGGIFKPVIATSIRSLAYFLKDNILSVQNITDEDVCIDADGVTKFSIYYVFDDSNMFSPTGMKIQAFKVDDSYALWNGAEPDTGIFIVQTLRTDDIMASREFYLDDKISRDKIKYPSLYVFLKRARSQLYHAKKVVGPYADEPIGRRLISYWENVVHRYEIQLMQDSPKPVLPSNPCIWVDSRLIDLNKKYIADGLVSPILSLNEETPIKHSSGIPCATFRSVRKFQVPSPDSGVSA